MNHLIKIISLASLFFIVARCMPPTQPIPNNTPARSDEDYDRRNRNDRDRRATIENSKRRHGGSICENEDKRHDCRKICKDIYDRRSDREDCEELTITQIERFEQVYEVLEDPDDKDLEALDLRDLDVLINISIEPFDDAIRKYSKSETKDVLTWIAQTSDVAELFEDEDDDFEILHQLLKKISSFTTDFSKPFLVKIDGGDRLLDISIEEGNDFATEYFQDYILEKQTTCANDETSEACFKTFCKIGKGIDDDQADDWLKNDDFEKYIENIIDDKTNGASAPNSRQWDTDDIEDTGDLGDWVDDLCGGLTS